MNKHAMVFIASIFINIIYIYIVNVGCAPSTCAESGFGCGPRGNRMEGEGGTRE